VRISVERESVIWSRRSPPCFRAAKEDTRS
jgi:hypothetical protein